ncbi:MAG: phosphate ABC transporter substrate-binding protein [Pseudomonadota bacterium]|nr:phosphate ABC transporter substrate-binding protein [Pseudomonadota bacterium]
MLGNRVFRAGIMLSLFAISVALTASITLATAAKPIDYKLATGVSGNLNSIGSDTLNNLMTLWGEGFKKLYPNVLIQIEGKGSSTAPPALIAGTAQLAPMSRAMTSREIETFERKYGFKPTRYATAVDSLAIYVHKDNPLPHLSLAQVDAIFSRTRNGKHPSDITTWGQLGLKGKWVKKPISLYGRNSASGTYGFFKKKALFKGDFKEIVKEQPGSASVVNGVGKDLYAIGYSGIGYRTGDVRALPLKKTAEQRAVAPTFVNVLNRTYSLGRALHVYVVQHPSKPMSKLVKEFLKYVLSDEGQRIVSKDGYGKLPYSLRSKQLSALK